MAELSAQGPVGFPGGTSVVFTTPYPLRLGSRARDVDGNEYIFLAYNTPVYKKAPVVIMSDFTAQNISVAERGPIGIVTTTGSSDNAGWVQIYGRCIMQVGVNVCSPSDDANGPTTLATSVPTRFMIPSSLTSPADWITSKMRGSSHRPRPITASQSCGSTRARLPGMPPPVTWQSACTSVCLRRWAAAGA